VKLQKVFFSQT
jgi:hypothetical protein